MAKTRAKIQPWDLGFEDGWHELSLRLRGGRGEREGRRWGAEGEGGGRSAMRKAQGSARPSRGGGALGNFKLWWLCLNTLLVVGLLSRRILDVDTKATVDVGCQPHRNRHAPCDPGCGDHGKCEYGSCVCDKGWSGELCSLRTCPKDCSNNGFCLNETGVCVCNRRYTGEDCSVDVSLLKEEEIHLAVSDKLDRSGRIDRDIEHVVSARAAKKYHFDLCRNGKGSCSAGWLSQMMPLMPLLPREDARLKFPSCAVVSSGVGAVFNASTGDRRETARGEEIDRHRAVFRLNNAPTEGFEEFVGRRTTHRLVQADYAQLVQNLIGTEVTRNETKSLVSPMNWWAGGYPQNQKVTYMMVVFPTVVRNQVRPPENNGYGAFRDAFPGNRRHVLSPHLTREISDIYGKYREAIKTEGLGCYKSKTLRVPQLFTAVLYSLQVCQKVHVYGVAQDATGTKCCYHPEPEGFSSRNPVCDDLTKSHVFRILLKTGRLFLYD